MRCFILTGVSLLAAPLELKSPNGELKISVDLKDNIFYNISYGQDELLENCLLQQYLQNESLGVNPKFESKKVSTVNKTIMPIFPFKYVIVRNNYNVMLLNFKNDFTVEFRAYNEGRLPIHSVVHTNIHTRKLNQPITRRAIV